MKRDGLAFDVHGDAGDWLLMINGIGAPRGSWALQIDDLSQRFRCITFDNPGIGESDVWSSDLTSASMADSAAQVLDIAGVERAHIMGVSMGGAIAQQLMLRHPGRVEKAMVVCSWAACDRYLDRCFTIMRDMAAADARPSWSVSVQKFLSLIGFTKTDFAERYESIQAIEDMVEAAARDGHEEKASTFVAQANACLGHDTRQRLGEVTTPTLIMAGDEDAFTPIHLSHQLRDAIPGAAFQVMEGCGHVMFYERPGEFNARVADFLTSA